MYVDSLTFTPFFCSQAYIYYLPGLDSVVGIAARFRLDSPAIQYWWGARFSSPVQISPVALEYRVCFPGIKWPGRGVEHPHPSSTEVKQSRAIPLLPLWVSWPVIR
jgi:hypothetical protein